METNSQHFIKIEIKGDERNLPKEDGEYLALKNGYYNPENLMYESGNTYMIEYWRKNIVWYLLPVTEPQQPEHPESIREISKKIYQANHKDFFFTDSDEAFHKGIELGVEFASQSPSKAVIMPNEEDVMTYFNLHSHGANYGGSHIPIMTHSEAMEMCKWFRSHVREVELKEKVLEIWEAFILKTRRGDNKSLPFRTFVDDYLSARKEDENE